MIEILVVSLNLAILYLELWWRWWWIMLRIMLMAVMTMILGLKRAGAESHYLISLPGGAGGRWEKAINLDSDHFSKHRALLILILINSRCSVFDFGLTCSSWHCFIGFTGSTCAKTTKEGFMGHPVHCRFSNWVQINQQAGLRSRVNNEGMGERAKGQHMVWTLFF